MVPWSERTSSGTFPWSTFLTKRWDNKKSIKIKFIKHPLIRTLSLYFAHPLNTHCDHQMRQMCFTENPVLSITMTLAWLTKMVQNGTFYEHIWLLPLPLQPHSTIMPAIWNPSLKTWFLWSSIPKMPTELFQTSKKWFTKLVSKLFAWLHLSEGWGSLSQP